MKSQEYLKKSQIVKRKNLGPRAAKSVCFLNVFLNRPINFSHFAIWGKKGFTLTEMVIYVAILSILAIVAINASFSAIRSFAELRVARDLNSSAASLLERMTREIRMARAVDLAQSSLGVNPGRLTLLTKDLSGADTTVEFYAENGALKIKEGGAAMGALTASTTAIANFTVHSLSNPKSSAVKAELGLIATRGGVSKSGNFYTTILLRGSY